MLYVWRHNHHFHMPRTTKYGTLVTRTMTGDRCLGPRYFLYPGSAFGSNYGATLCVSDQERISIFKEFHLLNQFLNENHSSGNHFFWGTNATSLSNFIQLKQSEPTVLGNDPKGIPYYTIPMVQYQAVLFTKQDQPSLLLHHVKWHHDIFT